MNIQRRSLLKGMVAGGVGCGLLGASSLAMARAKTFTSGKQQMLIVTSSAEAEQTFRDGVRAARPEAAFETLRSDLSPAFLATLEKHLRSGHPSRILGLVDDASAAVIVQLARSADARVAWVGQHHIEPGQARHSLLVSRSSRNCTLHFGEQLNRCGSGYELKEQRPQGGGRPLVLASARSGNTGWGASLGYALAQPADGIDGIASQAAALSLYGRYVSFLIEV